MKVWDYHVSLMLDNVNTGFHAGKMQGFFRDGNILVGYHNESEVSRGFEPMVQAACHGGGGPQPSRQLIHTGISELCSSLENRESHDTNAPLIGIDCRVAHLNRITTPFPETLETLKNPVTQQNSGIF